MSLELVRVWNANSMRIQKELCLLYPSFEGVGRVRLVHHDKALGTLVGVNLLCVTYFLKERVDSCFAVQSYIVFIKIKGVQDSHKIALFALKRTSFTVGKMGYFCESRHLWSVNDMWILTLTI